MKTYTTIPEYLREKNPHSFATPEYWEWERANRWGKYTRPVVIVTKGPAGETTGWVVAESALPNLTNLFVPGAYWFFLDEAGKADGSSEDRIKDLTDQLAAKQAVLHRIHEWSAPAKP